MPFRGRTIDLRQTSMGLGKALDDGEKVILFQDREGEEWAVNIRVLSVRYMSKNTPLILVMYRSFTPLEALLGISWLQEQVDNTPPKPDGTVPIRRTYGSDLERKLLLKVLAINARHLPKDFQPERSMLEEDFKVSFLLPFGPLTLMDVAKLVADFGCAVCGKKTTSRCSQCQSVSYCSPDCQKADWTAHKAMCRSFKGATWRTIKLSHRPLKSDAPVISSVNFAAFPNLKGRPDPDELKDVIRNYKKDSPPPPNIHGEKIFLVKIQRSTDVVNPLDAQNMYIYDRQRSCEFYFLRDNDNEGTFMEILNVMLGPKGGPYDGLKMYRWAKRTGDLELSICLDREPKETIKW
ncbi:MYND-type zinc finger protein samB [Abortiporus biennis]